MLEREEGSRELPDEASPDKPAQLGSGYREVFGLPYSARAEPLVHGRRLSA